MRVADLVEAPWNFRTHPESQRAALDGAVGDLGFYGYPDAYERADGRLGLVDGHLRREWLLGKYGPDAEIEVNLCDFTEAEAKKATLTKDPLAAMAGVDKGRLEGLLGECSTDNPALAKMLDQLGKKAGLDWHKTVVEDVPPDLPETEPQSVRGVMWMLGTHRLVCGDATNRDDVQKVLGGARVGAVITDPPYGVSCVGKTADALTITGDGAAGLQQLLSRSLRLAFEFCIEGGAWYVAAPAGLQFFDFAFVLKSLGVWRQTLVWAKQSIVMGHSDYHYQHEAVFYGHRPGGSPAPVPELPADCEYREGHEAVFYGWHPGGPHAAPPDRKQSTLWYFDRPSASRQHPTMKPVKLMAKMLENSTAEGTLVYDPFLGSGSTLIAADQLGRRVVGLELDPRYCDVICQRFFNFTGVVPVTSAGVPFVPAVEEEAAA